MNAPLPVEPRLIKGTVRDPETGCLIWMRSKNSRGYGLIGVDGHLQLVHRVAHEIWIGPIPAGYQVDHVYDNGCRSKLCIEPTHLEAVTAQENMARTSAARKTHCLRDHPLTGHNLRVNRSGRRSCRTCARAAAAAARATAKGLTAGKNGDHSVSSAPVHVDGEPDQQMRLDRPVALELFPTVAVR